MIFESYTLFVSLPLTVIAFTFLFLAVLTKRDDIAYKQFVFLCIIIAGWNLFETLFYSVTDIGMAEFFFMMRFLFVPYLGVAVFMYACKFSGIEKIFSPKVFASMFIFPTVTVIINFTNDFHGLFRAHFEVLKTAPIVEFTNERGPWFLAHSVFTYVFLAAAFVTVIYKATKVTSASRIRYYMVIVGVLPAIAANMYTLIVAFESPVDITLWGMTFGLIFQYFAMDTTPTSTYMLARNQSFDSLSDYAFILDDDENIADINRSAREWLKRLGINSDPLTLDALFKVLKTKGATIESDNEVEYRELFFTDEKSLLLSSYTIKSNPILNKKNIVTGAILTFSDMTAVRKLFRELQSQSTIDELTGTYNRRGYEKALIDYDADYRLPLCVIIGDVNGLKRVNDTLGHSVGDHILRLIALTLVECTGEKGMAARIGGDEFAIVLPGCDETAAEKIVSEIRAAIARKEDLLHGAGLAVGYAIKTDPGQDLAEIIDEADKKMYVNKNNDRRQRR